MISEISETADIIDNNIFTPSTFWLLGKIVCYRFHGFRTSAYFFESCASSESTSAKTITSLKLLQNDLRKDDEQLLLFKLYPTMTTDLTS